MNTLKRLGISTGFLVCAAALAHCSDTTSMPTMTDMSVAMDLAQAPDLAVAGPTVTTISPSSGLNTAATVVTISGTGFQQGATVQIGGVAATNVMFVSATQLTATVPAKAATCGAAPVVVKNPDNLTATSPTGFTYRPAALTFGTATSLAMPNNPRRVIIVDLNKDSKPDLVTANSGNSSINVGIGNGDGTFKAAVNYSLGAGTQPYAVAAGDIDNNGTIDLVTANNASNNISLRLGAGDGTFTTPTTDKFNAGAGPYDIALGDIDGDGKLDVVVANDGSNNVSLLVNTFPTFKTAVSTATGNRPQGLVLADFNKDQKPDFATADSNGSSITVRLNNGAGGFGALGSTITNVSTPNYLVAADLDGNGNLDIATPNGGAATLRVSPGNGDGSFAAGSTTALPAANGNRWVTKGDFNLDGIVDLAVTNSGNNTLSILVGKGDGTFTVQAPITFAANVTPMHLSAGDLNSDGLVDLVLADPGTGTGVVQIVLNKCN